MLRRFWRSQKIGQSPIAPALAWCLAFGVLLGISLIPEILISQKMFPNITWFPTAVIRSLSDLFLCFSAGGLGIAIAHLLVKKSMATTNERLQTIIDETLKQLNEMLELRNKEGGGEQKTEAPRASPTKAIAQTEE